MKKYLALCMLLLLCLTACGRQEPAAPPAPPAEQEEELLQLGSLTVEISRGSLTAEQLASAVKELPVLLENYLIEGGAVQVEDVRVTVGASSAVTARALAEGTVDLAFLPTEGFLQNGGAATALYGAGAESGDGLRAGVRGLICAAPTEYGRQLDERAGSGKPLSWGEVSRARWGVLGETSLDGYRCFDLWLADNYEGARVRQLPVVTVYGSEEDLFRAAAAGELDAFVIRDDAREDVAEVWQKEMGQSDGNAPAGFGRTEPIWQEVPVLDVTERVCGVVAAVAAGNDALEDARFSKALAAALERISAERPELAAVLGAVKFAPVEPENLETMRRLMYIEHEE